MSLDSSENFWLVHPDYKVAQVFCDLYRKDKTRGKDQSSKVAWCVKLIWDRSSIFYHSPEFGPDGKIAIVCENVIGDAKYYDKNIEKIQGLKDAYYKLTDTPGIKSLRNLEKKLDERDKFLNDTEYTMGEKGERGYQYGTADTLDKMIANTSKLYAQYDDAMKLLSNEQQTSTKGDVTQSLSDQGLL